MKTVLINGKIITPMRIIDNGILAFEGEKISYVGDKKGYPITEEDQVIDVKGQYISPGFIDIHTHGAGGHDFMDGTIEAFLEAAHTHMEHGSTTLIPTTLTSTMEDLFQTLDLFKEAKRQNKGPHLLGLHLEGPYFSMEQRGAQDPKYIKNPEKEEYEKIVAYSPDIVRWTIAPELEGALPMGSALVEKGIVPSIGHSNAVYEDVLKAYEHGYCLMTHFYSGMSTVTRVRGERHAGVIESGYLIDEMFVEVIADGLHLPKSLLQLIYKVKGSDRICLVTDSMRAAGCEEGEYVLGNKETGQPVLVKDGVARLMDESGFAGSVATADRLIRTMIHVAEVPLQEAVKMMTLNPARVMKIDHKTGSLAVGKEADIIAFDDNIHVSKVWVGGTLTKEE